MTKKLKCKVCSGVICCAAIITAFSSEALVPRVRITAKIIDEGGIPVAGATIRLSFSTAVNPRGLQPMSGITDEAGRYTAEGHSDGLLGTKITKEGYYDGVINLPQFTDIQDGKWQPWDAETTTVLRRIGNPVPLCVKVVRSHIPVIGEPCGYDLEVGDWVRPNGKGRYSDLIFNVTKDYRSQMDFEAAAEVTFAQPRDGINKVNHPFPGYFIWERFAPESGYAPRHLIFISDRGDKFQANYDIRQRTHGWFVRVRTIEENGRIISANYAKVLGDIGIDPRSSPTCSVMFTYYFNPVTSDRNLEWNIKKNLLEGLTDNEIPRTP